MAEIVADGSSEVGFGHVGRCLAIAEALDGQVVFRVDDRSAAAFVTAHGAEVGSAAEAPLVIVDRARPTEAALVADLQREGRKVLLVDDPGVGRTLADMVLDPPTGGSWPPAGSALVLSGFEHVLLRNEVLEEERGDGPEDVFVALGGSDPTARTPGVVLALSGAGVERLKVNLGPGYRGPRPEIGDVLQAPADFVPTLAGARLLVAAWGHSVLEAAYLGVPVVIAVTQPEHRDDARAFTDNGTALLVDLTKPGGEDDLGALVGELLADPPRLHELGDRGRRLIDGHGASRVAAEIHRLVG